MRASGSQRGDVAAARDDHEVGREAARAPGPRRARRPPRYAPTAASRAGSGTLMVGAARPAPPFSSAARSRAGSSRPGAARSCSTRRVVPERRLRAVAVVDVPVDDGDALDPVRRSRAQDRERRAAPHRPRGTPRPPTAGRSRRSRSASVAGSGASRCNCEPSPRTARSAPPSRRRARTAARRRPSPCSSRAHRVGGEDVDELGGHVARAAVAPDPVHPVEQAHVRVGAHVLGDERRGSPRRSRRAARSPGPSRAPRAVISSTQRPTTSTLMPMCASATSGPSCSAMPTVVWSAMRSQTVSARRSRARAR